MYNTLYNTCIAFAYNPCITHDFQCYTPCYTCVIHEKPFIIEEIERCSILRTEVCYTKLLILILKSTISKGAFFIFQPSARPQTLTAKP